MKVNRILQLSVSLFIIIAVLVLVAKISASKKPQQKEIPARPVKTALAVQKDVSIYLDSFGSLSPSNDVNIKSQVTGEIKECHFNEGQDVAKGDLLFTIDTASFQANLDKTVAALAADTADLNLKKDTLARNKTLVEQQLISQQEYDKIQADAASAEAKIKVDQSNIDLAQINLGYCSIGSPIDGVTGKRQVDSGNIVTANTGPTLVNIKTIDPLYVDFTLSEGNLTKVRSAMDNGQLKVAIIIDGDENNKFPGQLQFLSNTVDNTTGTIALRAVVPNKERKLWPGQFARVRLVLGISSNAVIVPYESVQLGQKGNYLFVVTPDNKADLRLVSTGAQVDDDIVIGKGVEAGEKVVISGQMGLAPGVAVQEVKN